MQKGFAPVYILVGVLILVAVGGGAFYFGKLTFPFLPSPRSTPVPKACTEKAKICPDGSSVGRVGPNCEFARCPSASDEIANWKTYTNTKYNYEINYPENWKPKEPKPSDYNGKGAEYKYYNLELQSPDYTSNITSPEEPYLFIKSGSRILISNPVAITPGRSLVEYIKEQNGLIDERSIRETKINGLETVEAESSIQLGTQYQISKHYYIVFNDELYEITRTYIKGQESEYQKIFNQILSTFKFVSIPSESTFYDRCFKACPSGKTVRCGDECSE